MNFNALHTVQKSQSLNSYETLCLIAMLINSKNDNYDINTDTVKNIRLSSDTLKSLMKCGKTTVYETLASLKKRKVLIDERDHEFGRNNYTLHVGQIKRLDSLISKIEDLQKDSPHDTLKGSPYGKDSLHDSLEGSPRDTERSPDDTQGSPRESNHNIYNNIYKNNVNVREKESYSTNSPSINQDVVVFKKIKEFTNRTAQINNILLHLKKLELIKGESALRAIPDIVADLEWHAEHHGTGMSEVGAVNAGLKLIQQGTWTRPRGLREKLEQEAIGKEQASKTEKKEEYQDLLKNGILVEVFGEQRSSKETARFYVQQMQQQLQKSNS